MGTMRNLDGLPAYQALTEDDGVRAVEGQTGNELGYNSGHYGNALRNYVGA